MNNTWFYLIKRILLIYSYTRVSTPSTEKINRLKHPFNLITIHFDGQIYDSEEEYTYSNKANQSFLYRIRKRFMQIKVRRFLELISASEISLEKDKLSFLSNAPKLK